VAERMKGSPGRARKSGMRPLLLAEHRNRFGPGSRWHMPGYVSEYGRAGGRRGCAG